jgi:hypothetical protein
VSQSQDSRCTYGALGKEKEGEVIGGKRVKVVHGRKSAGHKATGLKEQKV